MARVSRAGTIASVGVARNKASKTIAFTGAAGSGAIGTVNVFTISGRVYIDRITAFCTETLTGVGGIVCGFANDTDALMTTITAANFASGEFWASGNVVPGSVNMPRPTAGAQGAGIPLDKATSESVILTISGANVDDGTIIFDVWYTPITDGASLVAA